LKLKTEGINEYLLKTLKKIQRDELFNDFNLVGGTALSLHIGHRISDDIDLFTDKKFNRETIEYFIKNNIDKNAKIINNQGNIFQMFIEKERLKLDFVELPYPLLDPVIKTEEIRLAGINDISAMKVAATGTRGYEAKDFFDLYYLLKEITIDKIFDNFIKKYQQKDFLHYVRSVIFFDDVPDSSWNALKPLKEKVSKNEIQDKLIKEVTDFQKKYIHSRL